MLSESWWWARNGNGELTSCHFMISPSPLRSRFSEGGPRRRLPECAFTCAFTFESVAEDSVWSIPPITLDSHLLHLGVPLPYANLALAQLTRDELFQRSFLEIV